MMLINRHERNFAELGIQKGHCKIKIEYLVPIRWYKHTLSNKKKCCGAKHRGAMYRKSDSDDAGAIALATLTMLDTLPDAWPNNA